MQKRKRPASNVKIPVPLDGAVGSAGLDHAVAERQAAPHLDRNRLLQNFTEALSADGSLDPAEQLFLVEQYDAALDAAIERSAELVPLNKENITQAVDFLGEQSQANDADKSAVIRKFNETLSSLDAAEKAKMEMATLYLAKLEAEGSEAALQWLAEYSSKSGEVGGLEQQSFHGAGGHSLAQAITRSKSRRLRGPP